MIILDTNVISEPLKKNPDPKVIQWLDEQDPNELHLTAVTLAKMEYGLWALPSGKRRADLHNAITEIRETDFRGRILDFDTKASIFYGGHMATARSAGKAVGELAGMIAAIALANDRCRVATRDIEPFRAMQVEVINPWD